MAANHPRFKRRVTSAILLLLLTSCHNNWHYQSLDAGYKEHVSSRLIYAEENNPDSLSLELIRCHEQEHLYLIVRQFQLIQDPDRMMLVEIAIDGEIQTFTAIRRDGGQKVLLPEEAKNFIISKWLEDKEVVFRIGNHSLTAKSEGFKKHFQKSALSSLLPF